MTSFSQRLVIVEQSESNKLSYQGLISVMRDWIRAWSMKKTFVTKGDNIHKSLPRSHFVRECKIDRTCSNFFRALYRSCKYSGRRVLGSLQHTQSRYENRRQRTLWPWLQRYRGAVGSAARNKGIFSLSSRPETGVEWRGKKPEMYG